MPPWLRWPSSYYSADSSPAMTWMRCRTYLDQFDSSGYCRTPCRSVPMRRRRQFLALFAATSCLLMIVCIALYFAAKHEPAFYRRGEIATTALRRQLAEDFLRCSSEVYNLMANGKPWALNITQD